MYTQDAKSFEITFQQEAYAKHLRPISLSKQRQRQRDSPATEQEVRALRAVNGAANGLSSQTRPDLSVQTSFSQQAFPHPKVRDLMYANQLVHVLDNTQMSASQFVTFRGMSSASSSTRTLGSEMPLRVRLKQGTL